MLQCATYTKYINKNALYYNYLKTMRRKNNISLDFKTFVQGRTKR